MEFNEINDVLRREYQKALEFNIHYGMRHAFKELGPMYGPTRYHYDQIRFAKYIPMLKQMKEDGFSPMPDDMGDRAIVSVDDNIIMTWWEDI